MGKGKVFPCFFLCQYQATSFINVVAFVALINKIRIFAV